MPNRTDLRVLLAAYETPGIAAAQRLFAEGVTPDRIRLLTHPLDERNEPLIAFAWAHHIETTYHPAKSAEALAWARAFAPDVIFALHYMEKIPQRLLTLAPLGGVNMHPAPLPFYRGCFSTPWAIFNGETETGFTYHYMTDEFDAGDVVLQRRLPIAPHDTHFTLFHKLMLAGCNAFPEVLRLVVDERFPGIPQEGEGSYYPKRLPNNGVIDPSWDDAIIERFIRALDFPPASAVVLIDGKPTPVRSMAEYHRLRRP
ncbi:MAG: formyltransferase family protein [Deltaproteobacteria bacterium]|nr:formyltransferase family protein [Deltaproteobacteria bacterium]